MFVWQQGTQACGAHYSLPARPPLLCKDLGSSRLNDAPVWHPGRANSLAGAALQAEVEVVDYRVIQGGASLVDGTDKGDAAARRFELETSLHVGRTRVQAETAMDASGQIGVGGSIGSAEAGGGSERNDFGGRVHSIDHQA